MVPAERLERIVTPGTVWPPHAGSPEVQTLINTDWFLPSSQPFDMVGPMSWFSSPWVPVLRQTGQRQDGAQC